MDKIREKIWKEERRRSLSLDTRLLSEQVTLDNNLVQLCLQSSKLESFEQNNTDVYILWLTNEHEKDFELFNDRKIRIFNSNNNLIDFINELETANVFLIIDHQLISNILSCLDDLSQILFIYVLTNENTKNTLITIDSKRSIRQISNNKEELFRLIIEDIDTCTKDLISSDIFDLTTTEESTNQTKNKSFIWYYLLIESLFDINVFNENARSDLIEYCHQQYSIDNIQQHNLITKFENEYSSENAIQWYTRDSFIYRQLNKALRTRDIDAIFKFRFFIIDFQKQLEQHYNEEMNQLHQIVYRGQQISQLELTKLKNSLGKYISFNTYLSASLDKNIALIYTDEILSVLFEIEITSTAYIKNKRVRPVYVKEKSYFPQELEVIFPIGSTFLVNSVAIEDDKWNIKLKLTDDDDYNQIIDLMKAKFKNKVPSKIQFADLLLSSGDYEKAERYTNLLIKDLQLSSDNVNIGYAYYLIGKIYYEKGDHQCALSYYEKALNNIEPENIYRATIYCDIGVLYAKKAEYNTALNYLNQALEYKQEIDPLALVDIYKAFGDTYRQMRNLDDALTYLNRALNIHRSNLPTHYGFWSTYLSLGLVYSAKFDYKQALQLSKQALRIFSDIAPKNHPRFIFLYAFIGIMYVECQDLSLAMIYLQKALHLIQTVGPNQNLDPVIHIFVCNALVEFYTSNGDPTNAFYYAQEAFNIFNQFKNLIPQTFSIVRIIHFNLGCTYLDLGNFTSALEFFSKALDLSQNIEDQRLILLNIGKIYLNRGDTENALRYFNDSLHLNAETNQPITNDWIVPRIFLCMSEIYRDENNVEKAIFSAKEALRLCFDQTNRYSDEIAHCYMQLMDLCPEEKKNYIKEILEIVQKHDFSFRTRTLFYHILGRYYTEQNDFSNALYYYQSFLKYELTRMSSCFEDLILIYCDIGEMYAKIEGEDSDTSLFYYKKGRDIYLKLLNMERIPIKDKKRMSKGEGYISENVNERFTLIFKIFVVYYSIAKYYVKKGNYEEALNHLAKIEQILNEYNGKKDVIWLKSYYPLIGSIYRSMKYYDQAISWYKKKLDTSNDYNNYGDIFYLIARVYQDKKEYLMAISKCKIALTFLHNSQSIDHGDLARCYRVACLCYKEINNNEYACIYCRQAIEHYLLCNPINYDMIVLSYIDYAYSLHSLKPWDNDQPLNEMLIANQFSQYISEDDSLKRLYFTLGSFYGMNRKYDDALFYSNKSLEYCKELDDVIYFEKQRFYIYLLMGKFDKSFDIIKKIIDNQFNLKIVNFIDISESYICMGGLYHQLGKYKLALKCYRSAFYILQIYQNDRTHINYTYIYNYIGIIHLEYGQVIDAFNLCLRARNTYYSNKNNQSYIIITINITLGLIECKLENYYIALDYFGEAWQNIFKENLQYHYLYRILYNHIGYVYFKLGQTQIAMKNYLKSLSLYGEDSNHPDLAPVYKNIGLIYEQDKENYPLALSFYKRALEYVPNKQHPHYILYTSMIITLELKSKKKIGFLEKTF